MFFNPSYNFSHILKLESMSEEWPLFLRSVNLPDSLVLPWRNPTRIEGNPYLDTLSNDEKNQVFLKFRADFEMFGYSMDDAI